MKQIAIASLCVMTAAASLPAEAQVSDDVVRNGSQTADRHEQRLGLL